MNKGKILIIDDHKMFALSLSALLQTREYETHVVAPDNDDLIDKHIKFAKPDVILLDVHLDRDKSGFDLAEMIIENNSEQKILLISGYDFPEYFIKAQYSCVKGFINKAASDKVLIEAIETIKNGGTLFHNPVTKSSDISSKSITARERVVLQNLADGLTINQIAANLYVAEKTVRNWIQAMNEKLGTNSYMQSVIKGIELGIVKIDI